MKEYKAIIYDATFSIDREKGVYGTSRDMYLFDPGLYVRFRCCDATGNNKKLTVQMAGVGPYLGPWVVDDSGKGYYAKNIQNVNVTEEFRELCLLYIRQNQEAIKHGIISRLFKIQKANSI